MQKTEVSGDTFTRLSSWQRMAQSPIRKNFTTLNAIGLGGGLLALFLLLVLPVPWNFRIPLYLVVFIWTVLRPRVTLYLLPFAVPWGSIDPISVGGLHLNSADILVVLLASSWLLSFTLRHRNFSLTTYTVQWQDTSSTGPLDYGSYKIPSYLLWSLLGLLATMLLSIVATTSISSSLKEISKWLEFLTLILLGTQYIRTRRQLWTMIVLICLAGITQAIFGYLQYSFNLGPSAFVRDASLRVYGTFDQPNPYAGYINIPLSIAISLLLLGRNWTTRLFAGITVVLLGTAEYLSKSRGGEIAIAVVILYILLAGVPFIRTIRTLLVVAGLALVALLLTDSIPSYVFEPISRTLGLTQISFIAPSPQDFSTAERLAHWIAGIHMFLDHPWIGVGIGNYPDVYPHYSITIFVNSLGHAHNYYINIAAETGAIGLMAFLLFLIAIFVVGANAFRSINTRYLQTKKLAAGRLLVSETRRKPAGLRNKISLLLSPLAFSQYYQQSADVEIPGMLTNDRALAIGLIAALLSVCVHNLVDNLFVHSLTNLIALLLIALIRLEGVTPTYKKTA